MKASTALVMAVFALALSACGTVDLDADPLLMPPQLVEPVDPDEKKATATVVVDVTLNA